MFTYRRLPIHSEKKLEQAKGYEGNFAASWMKKKSLRIHQTYPPEGYLYSYLYKCEIGKASESFLDCPNG